MGDQCFYSLAQGDWMPGTGCWAVLDFRHVFSYMMSENCHKMASRRPVFFGRWLLLVAIIQ